MNDSRSEWFTAAIIPLVPVSLPGSSSLPEGSHPRWLSPPQTERAFFRKRAQRAGPALPSYLALHHAGFSVPPVLPPERWALTPPFHPCQTELAFRRRLAGFPVRCHRAPLRRRSILCGTFRDAVVAASYLAIFNLAPWRYQARCPLPAVPKDFGVIRHRLSRAYDDGVRTFLPPPL